MKVLELDKFVAHLNEEIDGCYDSEHGEDPQKRDVARGTRLGLNMAIAFAATIARDDNTEKIFEELDKIAVEYANRFISPVEFVGVLSDLRKKYLKEATDDAK